MTASIRGKKPTSCRSTGNNLWKVLSLRLCPQWPMMHTQRGAGSRVPMHKTQCLPVRFYLPGAAPAQLHVILNPESSLQTPPAEVHSMPARIRGAQKATCEWSFSEPLWSCLPCFSHFFPSSEDGKWYSQETDEAGKLQRCSNVTRHCSVHGGRLSVPPLTLSFAPHSSLNMITWWFSAHIINKNWPCLQDNFKRFFKIPF